MLLYDSRLSSTGAEGLVLQIATGFIVLQIAIVSITMIVLIWTQVVNDYYKSSDMHICITQL